MMSCVLAMMGCAHQTREEEPRRAVVLPRSEIADAVRFIQGESDYMVHFVKANTSGRQVAPTEYYLTLATLNYVQSRMSPPYRGNRVELQRLPFPTEPEGWLRAQGGICGEHTETFLMIAKKLGLRARSVEMYYEGVLGRDSHAAVEVFWLERWHFFDISFGAFFRRPDAAPDDVLSLAEVRATDNVMQFAVINRANAWLQAWEHAGRDAFEYVAQKNLDILYAGTGTTTPTQSAKDETRNYDFKHLPSYVGRTRSYGGADGEHSVRLTALEGASSVMVSVKAVACGAGKLVLKTASQSTQIDVKRISPRGSFSIPLKSPASEALLSMVSAEPGAPCCLVFNGVRAEGLRTTHE